MFFVPETFFGFVQHVLVFRLSNDVFEQQPVFGDVLENNRKFAGVEKRCKFRPGLVGDLSGAESAAESLVSPACVRAQMFKPAVSTFLDLPASDTCSLSQRLSVWSPLRPTFVPHDLAG